MPHAASRARAPAALLALALVLAGLLAACAAGPSATTPPTASTSSPVPTEPGASSPPSVPPSSGIPSDPTVPPTAAPSAAPTKPAWKSDGTVVPETVRKLERQAAVDADLVAEMDSGAYTPDSPLVVVDPYDCSPLAALVLFRSEEPMAVSVHVAGRTDLDAVDFDLATFTREHWVPIYGLYAGVDNAVTLATRDAHGRLGSIPLTIRTQPLPQDLLDVSVVAQATGVGSVQPGFTIPFTCNERKIAFDSQGTVRWFLKGKYLQSGNYAYEGMYLLAQGRYGESDVCIQLTDPLGRIHRVFYEPYGLHHDVVAYGAHSLLCTNNQGLDVGDYMIELDAGTGAIVNRLDLDRVFQRWRTPLSIGNLADWLHQNTIVAIPGSTDILVSARNQSLIARISWPDGAVRWILSDPKGWNDAFLPRLLDPVGDGFLYAYGQHDPLILPDADGNPDTMDLLVFDNGLERFGSAADPRNATRLVRYRIDEANGTVEQLWQWDGGQGVALFSAQCGSVDVLPNGNLLADFHPTIDGTMRSKVLEIAPDGSVVWSAEVTVAGGTKEGSTYRTVRQSLYTEAAEALGIRVPAVDLIPASEKAKHGIPG